MIDLALVHHPVTDKRGDLVTTSVTNIDLHDIARSCRVFGVETFWVVTPVDAMHLLTERIIRHWREGWGLNYNPGRGEALKTIRLARSLEEVIASYAEGQRPRVVATSARPQGSLSIEQIDDIARQERLLVVFGTGNGLAPAALDKCDAILPPIQGMDEYNHLSVRSAVAIYLYELAQARRAASGK
jgi:tRNA (guanine37-N1)-methyltransferase